MADRNTIIDRFLHFVPDYKTNREYGEYDLGVYYSQMFYFFNGSQAPFAVLRGGDLLCFDCEGRDEAQVVLWDYELSGEDAPVTHPVAESFDAFVEIHQTFATE